MPIEITRSAVERFVALDAIRGAAALAVLFYHLRTLKAVDAPNTGVSIFASGYLAVDLFFVLSGFVIAHAYRQRLRTNMTFREFMIARFVRLQPVIAIGTLIGLVIAVTQRALHMDGAPGLFAVFTGLPANMLMLPNVFVPWGIFLFNPPAWSLFYEMVANAVYAAGIRVRPFGERFTTLLLVMICLIGLVAIAMAAALAGNLDKGVVLSESPIAAARITFSFTVGVLLQHMRAQWSPSMVRLPIPVLVVSCLALLMPDLKGTVRAGYDIAFVALCSPALLMLGSVARPSVRYERAAIWLGFISYPLYAVHAPLKHLLEMAFPESFWVLLIATAAGSILCAWLIAAFVDAPLRRSLARLLRPAATPLPPIARRTAMSDAMNAEQRSIS